MAGSNVYTLFVIIVYLLNVVVFYFLTFWTPGGKGKRINNSVISAYTSSYNQDGTFVNFYRDPTTNTLVEDVKELPTNSDGSDFVMARQWGRIVKKTDNSFDITYGLSTDTLTFQCPANFYLATELDGFTSCQVEDVCKDAESDVVRGINYYKFESLSGKLGATETLKFHPRIYAVCKVNETTSYDYCLENQIYNQLDSQPYDSQNKPCNFYDVCVEHFDGFRHNLQISSDYVLKPDEYYYCQNGKSVLESCLAPYVYNSSLHFCESRDICFEQADGVTPAKDATGYIVCLNQESNHVNCPEGVSYDSSTHTYYCFRDMCGGVVEPKITTYEDYYPFTYAIGGQYCTKDKTKLVTVDCSTEEKKQSFVYLVNGVNIFSPYVASDTIAIVDKDAGTVVCDKYTGSYTLSKPVLPERFLNQMSLGVYTSLKYVYSDDVLYSFDFDLRLGKVSTNKKFYNWLGTYYSNSTTSVDQVATVKNNQDVVVLTIQNTFNLYTTDTVCYVTSPSEINIYESPLYKIYQPILLKSLRGKDETIYQENTNRLIYMNSDYIAKFKIVRVYITDYTNLIAIDFESLYISTNFKEIGTTTGVLQFLIPSNLQTLKVSQYIMEESTAPYDFFVSSNSDVIFVEPRPLSISFINLGYDQINGLLKYYIVYKQNYNKKFPINLHSVCVDLEKTNPTPDPTKLKLGNIFKELPDLQTKLVTQMSNVPLYPDE